MVYLISSEAFAVILVGLNPRDLPVPGPVQTRVSFTRNLTQAGSFQRSPLQTLYDHYVIRPQTETKFFH